MNLKLLTHELVEVKVLERGTYLREETGFGAQPSLSGHFNLKLAEAHHRVAARRGGLLLRLLQRDQPRPARSSTGLGIRRTEGNSGPCTRLLGIARFAFVGRRGLCLQ